MAALVKVVAEDNEEIHPRVCSGLTCNVIYAKSSVVNQEIVDIGALVVKFPIIQSGTTGLRTKVELENRKQILRENMMSRSYSIHLRMARAMPWRCGFLTAVIAMTSPEIGILL